MDTLGSGGDHPVGRRWGRAGGREGRRCKELRGRGPHPHRWAVVAAAALASQTVSAAGGLPFGAPPEVAAAVSNLPAPHVAQLAGAVVGGTVASASWAPVLAPYPPGLGAFGASALPSDDEVALAPPPDAFEVELAGAVDPPVALAGPAPTGVPEGTGTWAVSIGINDYPGRSHDLRSAVADALEVDQALAGYGVPPEQRLLITDRAASADTIGRALDWLLANAGPDANVVFFYAGHVRKLAATSETIVGADGETLDDVEVAERLRPLAARRAWIAIAACYGGGFTEVLEPGRILTAAAGPDDLAYENTQLGRSYLVEYMVRRAMAGGEAPTSVEAAFAYAAEAIAREHPNRVPVQDDRLEGELSFGPASQRAQRSSAMPASHGQAPQQDAPQQQAPQQEQAPQSPPEKGKDRCLGSGLRVVRCES